MTARYRLRLLAARVLHALVGRHSLYETRIGHTSAVACRFCDLDRSLAAYRAQDGGAEEAVDVNGCPDRQHHGVDCPGRRLSLRTGRLMTARPQLDDRDLCLVCGSALGGEHGTPAMAHDCEFPGCVFGPLHTVRYHFVNGQRVPR